MTQNAEPSSFMKRVPIALLIAAVTAVLSIGGLYQRVDALERADASRAEVRERLVRIETTVEQMNVRLERMDDHRRN